MLKSPVRYVEIAGTKIPLVARSDIPPTIPDQLNGTTARRIIFPAERNGYALDVVIDNLDAVNALTFAINGNNSRKTISVSGAFSFTDQVVVILEIFAGSTNWEVTFSLVPLGVREGEGWVG